MSETDTGSVEDRVDRLETGQQTLNEKLDQILGLVSGNPKDPELDARMAGRPGSVEEQVRAELARAERERKETEAADADKSDREQIREQLAKLREAAPVQPQRRSERAMWGPR